MSVAPSLRAEPSAPPAFGSSLADQVWGLFRRSALRGEALPSADLPAMTTEEVSAAAGALRDYGALIGTEAWRGDPKKFSRAAVFQAVVDADVVDFVAPRDQALIQDMLTAGELRPRRLGH